MRKSIPRLKASFFHWLPGWRRRFPDTNVLPAVHRFPERLESPDWRALYVAALFEKDEELKVERIDYAKKALRLRARELFQAEGDHYLEQTAIDDTLRSLQALEQCAVYLAHKGTDRLPTLSLP